MSKLTEATPHERAMMSLRQQCLELYQKMGRDGMLRQGDPVETLFAFVTRLISDREYVIGWNAGFNFAKGPKALAAANRRIEELERERDEARENEDDGLAWEALALMKRRVKVRDSRIAEALEDAEGRGFWRSCSGCHETNEGYPTGEFDMTFRCHLGVGCTECGGIGAIWDTTDYADMADFMLGQSDVEARAESAEAENAKLREFASWVDTWVSNPVSSYSVHALDGLFSMTRDRLATLSEGEAKR